MSGQRSGPVAEDSSTTQARSGYVATVKQSLTVQMEATRAPTTEESSVVQKEQT
jgi:hypothetical protein